MPASRLPRSLVLAALVLAAALVLGACAAGAHPAAVEAVSARPGFWLGLWHGLITPITFIVSLFTDGVSVYAVPNSGNWYDFGYVLGVMVAFSGPANLAAAPARRRRTTSAG